MEETIGYTFQIDGDPSVEKALKGAIRNAGVPVFKTESEARDYAEKMVGFVIAMGDMFGKEVKAEIVTVEVFFAATEGN